MTDWVDYNTHMESFHPPIAVPDGVLADLGVGRARSAWIEAVKAGLPVAAFVRLARHLRVSEGQLAEVVGLSTTTLARRKRTGSLAPGESEHVLRVAALLDRATEVFGDEAEAAAWLAAENLALGQGTPLDWADTEFGAREVEDLLGRLEHGVYT